MPQLQAHNTSPADRQQNHFPKSLHINMRYSADTHASQGHHRLLYLNLKTSFAAQRLITRYYVRCGSICKRVVSLGRIRTWTRASLLIDAPLDHFIVPEVT